MKFLLALFILFIVSCAKSDNNESRLVDVEFLSGEWEIDKCTSDIGFISGNPVYKKNKYNFTEDHYETSVWEYSDSECKEFIKISFESDFVYSLGEAVTTDDNIISREFTILNSDIELQGVDLFQGTTLLIMYLNGCLFFASEKVDDSENTYTRYNSDDCLTKIET